jgi:hypothetical protein
MVAMGRRPKFVGKVLRRQEVLVENPQEYLYSSAMDYAGGKGMVKGLSLA